MKPLLAFLAALQLLAFGVGCQDNWQSLYIVGNKRLGDPPGCAIPTDISSTGVIAGFVDTSVRDSYVGYLLVENGLISRADPGLPRAESNGIFVEGAYLDFQPDPACAAATPYPSTELRFAAYIAPESSSTIGIDLIPQDVGALMARDLLTCAKGHLDVTVTVQLFGVTQAGTDVLTQAFDYPVSYCYLCLAYCPVGMDADPTTPGCQCDCGNTEIQQADTPCLPGQDDAIDCRLTSLCN